MTLKLKMLLSLLLLVLAFVTGRWSNLNQKTIQIVTETQAEDRKQSSKDTHKKITTTVTEKPSGEKQTVTETTEDTVTDTQEVKDIKREQTQIVTAPKRNILNLSLLAGVDTVHGFIPVYGVSVTKQVLGPVSIGAWGLTNGTVGASVGITF